MNKETDMKNLQLVIDANLDRAQDETWEDAPDMREMFIEDAVAAFRVMKQIEIGEGNFDFVAELDTSIRDEILDAVGEDLGWNFVNHEMGFFDDIEEAA